GQRAVGAAAGRADRRRRRRVPPRARGRPRPDAPRGPPRAPPAAAARRPPQAPRATPPALDAAEAGARTLPEASAGLEFEQRNELVGEVLDELTGVQQAEAAVRALRRGHGTPLRGQRPEEA